MLHKPWVRYAIWSGIALVGVALLIILRSVLAPVLIALAVAYVCDPIIDRMEARKIPRTWGIVILLSVVGVIFLGVALYIIPKLIDQIRELTDALPEYVARLKEKWPEVQAYKDAHQEDYDQIVAWLMEQGKTHGTTLLKSVSLGVAASFRSMGTFFGRLVGLLIIPVLAFYLLRDFDIIRFKALDLVPERHREAVRDLFTELDQALGSFIKGQLTVAIILAIFYSVGLTICRCPASLLIGCIAGFANLVPYLGIALGFIPAVLLTQLAGNPIGFVIGAGLVFIAGQMLEGLVITPKVVGESVGLHPVVVMLALMVGGTYFGIVGMLLALPVAAVLLVIVRRGFSVYLQSSLYRDIHQPPPTKEF